MWTTIAFTEATGGAIATLTTVPLATDQVFRSTGNGVVVDPNYPYLGMVFSFAASLTRLQITSPTMRRLLNHEARPFRTTVDAANGLAVAEWFMDNPVPLGANEELDASLTDTASEQASIFLNLVDKPITEVKGPFYTALFTHSTTVTANGWTLCPLTSDQGLPPGNYDIAGARYEGASAKAFRLVFPGLLSRPGGIAHTVATSQDYGPQRKGKSGLWGNFQFNVIPSLEAFCTAGDTSGKLYLDLIPHLS